MSQIRCNARLGLSSCSCSSEAARMDAVDAHHVLLLDCYCCCMRSTLSCILVVMTCRATCIACCCLLKASSCDVQSVTWCKVCCSAWRIDECPWPACPGFTPAAHFTSAILLSIAGGASSIPISQTSTAVPVEVDRLCVKLCLVERLSLVSCSTLVELESVSLQSQLDSVCSDIKPGITHLALSAWQSIQGHQCQQQVLIADRWQEVLRTAASTSQHLACKLAWPYGRASHMARQTALCTCCCAWAM